MTTIFILPKLEELTGLSVNNNNQYFKIINPTKNIIVDDSNGELDKVQTAKNIISQMTSLCSNSESYLLYHIGDLKDLYEELKAENTYLNASLYSSADTARHEKVKILIKEVCEGNVTRSVDAVIKEFFYDKELEAKLNLLHLCLTPEGAKEAMQVQNYDLIKDIVESVKTEENQIVVEYLTKQTNCFDEELYLKPLTKLRDALLLA